MNKGKQTSVGTRTERLEEAWGLGIQGYYDSGLAILEGLLKENPQDVGSLRLKGNLLELKEMDRLEHSGRKLISSAQYLAARECYERILQIDADNVKAHIDLGDHYRNLDANDKALEWYAAAVKLLQRMPKGDTWKEDIQEIAKAVEPLKRHDRLAALAASLETWCSEALSAVGSAP